MVNPLEVFGMEVVAVVVVAVQTLDQNYTLLVASGPGNYALGETSYIPAAALCALVAEHCMPVAAL